MHLCIHSFVWFLRPHFMRRRCHETNRPSSSVRYLFLSAKRGSSVMFGALHPC